jgi:VIT1/CCC1 family predicted Fe2+/Mn2+ transporter
MLSNSEPYHQRKNWFADLILGGQDGLVNVLGIIFGVTAANGSNQILLAASLAAGLAEAVSMAAVSYTSQQSNKTHYEKEKRREYYEVDHMPEEEKKEIRDIYRQRGFKGKILEDIVRTITADKDVWVSTMMTDELGLEPVEMENIVKSAFLVGLSAVIGSLIPVLPFFFFIGKPAVVISLIISGCSLFAVGVYQAKMMVGNLWKSGLQMTVIGLGSALVGFLIGNLFKSV